MISTPATAADGVRDAHRWGSRAVAQRFLATLRLPVVASPMFIVSTPALVIAQCKAGVVGSIPALNARPKELLKDWIAEIKEALAAHDKAHPEAPSAPFAVNQIAHRTNEVFRVLTAISVIVLPLTLVASIWGMNVHVPGESDTLAFYLVVGVMLAMLVGLILYFRRRGWL